MEFYCSDVTQADRQADLEANEIGHHSDHVTGLALGCFVCTSVNGSNPLCEDTFNNVGGFYRPNCEGAREDRQGTFPATQCIKLTASLGEFIVFIS